MRVSSPFVTGTALCIWLAAGSPVVSTAQQTTSAAVTHDLLKSVGLPKPAITQAPEFNLRDANGGPVSLSGYRGRMVLLNFWATWCRPCRDEMPSMEHLSRSLGGQGLAVVAVNQRESAALVNRFMKTHGLNFVTPLDTDGRVSAAYRVYGIPVSYVIDGNGQAIGWKSGPMNWASPRVVDLFRKLIGDRSSGVESVGSIDLEPMAPLPKTLRGKSDGILVHGQQDTQAAIVGSVGRDEDFVPLGKVSAAGESWYMVKIRNGTIGWVRGADVEEVGARK